MFKSSSRLPLTIYLLSLCNAYLYVSASLLITVSALIGLDLAPDKRLSTLPMALQFFSIMCSSVPASYTMGKLGRKTGFHIASLIGIAGTTIAIWSIFNEHFIGYCIATVCFGIFAGFGNFYRFTAAEVVKPANKSAAISMVMAGGVIAAFIGPNLANWSSGMFDSQQYAGPFVVLMGVYLLSIFTISRADLPHTPLAKSESGGRKLLVIASQPVFVVAVICQMLGYGTMNFVMSSTPLAMHATGHGMHDTAFVIQWHVVAMFAPSFITGHLIKTIGMVSVLFLGVLLGFLSVAINLLAEVSVANFVIALVSLGISWNFLFVGGTALLTDTYEPAEKNRAQGLNDLAVFSTVTLTALTTGTVHHLYGWETVNLWALPMLGITFVAIVILLFHNRSVRNSATVVSQ